MNLKGIPHLLVGCLLGATVLHTACPDDAAAAQSGAVGQIFSYDDQYVQVESKLLPGARKNMFVIEASLTPKPGWKLLAGSSSAIRPLQLTVAPSKCLKLKGAVQMSPPDLSGTDDSGAFSEYYTKTATIRQDVTRIACKQKPAPEGQATLSYLLCQDNKCMGPFRKEIRFKAPDLK